ncbi:MAG: disulfide bond formation protein B [Patescibacteria group bacterium]
MISAANNIFFILAVLGQVGIAILIIARLAKKNLPFIRNRVLLLSFLVALAAVLGSLFYSEVAGYPPCELCWYQRIFMFPQVFILGLALIKKDIAVIPYVKTLSIVGALVAGYQSLLQMNLVPSLLCSATTPSCAQRFVMGFGYITLPVMSLTAFLLLILILSFRENK